MIHFFSPIRVEPWDYRNLEIGIGGSETSHIELAVRTAKRGYWVASYTDLPTPRPEPLGDVAWRDLAEADLAEPGLWIVYRGVQEMIGFVPRSDRKAWLIIQDTDPHYWFPGAADKFERIMALCPAHMEYLNSKYPEMGPKLCMFSNGIPSDRLRVLYTPSRDPYRMIFSSSPDRNLSVLLDIFDRVQEVVPQIRLDIYYGLDNVYKLIEKYGKQPVWIETIRIIERAQRMSGVQYHGRIPQSALHKEMLKTGLWVYPTSCPETSCITCMESQALGMYPIVRDYWALQHNVQYGIKIAGDPAKREVMISWVDAVVSVVDRLLHQDTSGWHSDRLRMMAWATEYFDWDRQCESLVAWYLEDMNLR